MRSRRELVATAAALLGGSMMAFVAWPYFAARGFPLDDAWIHLVYARSIAQSFAYAYNPGTAASGATSLLWPVLLAVPHLATTHVAAIVLAAKLLGFALHALACTVIVRALHPHRAAVIGGVLCALHPTLLAASVSGMEIPLAECAIAFTLDSVTRNRLVPLAVAALVCPLARPELALVAVLLALLVPSMSRVRTVAVVTAALTAVALVVGARNLVQTGSALPATFHAKTAHRLLSPPAGVLLGLVRLLPAIALAHPLVVLPLGAVAIRQRIRTPSVASAAFVTALVACLVQFVLVEPLDGASFYHQRYVLPALFLAFASAPAVFDTALADRGRRGDIARAGALIAALVVVGLAMPERFARLENDAHNIDDVQVAIGRTLAQAPPTRTVWTFDAGAVRYFGAPFVVDLAGLNSPAMLGTTARAQAWLDAHPASWFVLVTGGAAFERADGAPDGARVFVTSTPYTVTSFGVMDRQALAPCANGRIRVSTRAYEARCGQ